MARNRMLSDRRGIEPSLAGENIAISTRSLASRLKVVVATLLALAFLATPARAELKYRIIDLGPASGGAMTWGSALNDHGHVVGELLPIGETNGNLGYFSPMLWKNGTSTALWTKSTSPVVCHFIPESESFECDGPPYDVTGGSANAINNAGAVVGQMASPDPTTWLPNLDGFGQGTGYVWDSTNGRRALEGIENRATKAVAINNGGVIAGSAYVQYEYDLGGHHYTDQVPRAVYWDAAGNIRNLGTLEGAANDLSHSYDVNEEGVVVGYSSLPDGTGAAFVWDSVNGMRELSGLANRLIR